MYRMLRETPVQRISFILILFFGFHYDNNVLGNTNRQISKVTISANDIPLEIVFKIIKQQTGFTVYNNYKDTQLNEKKKVTVNFLKADIIEVMELLLNDKKNLSFILHDHTISIFNQKNTTKSNTTLVKKDTASSPLQLSGKVVDTNGAPIPGASIKLKNKNKYGTASNTDGSFRVSNIEKGSIVVISSIGFESKEIIADDKDFLVQLSPRTNLLDEKVIMAYGSTTKRLNTGNISSLKAIDIEKQPVNNPLVALQGRIPGIYIQQANGLPGSGVTVRIQGQNSLRSGNDPFYVVDGVPYVSQLLPTNNAIGSNPASGVLNGSPLNYMNSADIESIEVLKDADATAIYGSRAANGAVLITTKKGKAGPTRVNLTVQSGWSQIPRKMDVLNTNEYLSMRHEALKNDGSTASVFDWDLNGTWDTTRNVDWQEELIGKTAKYNDAQFSVSGGNAFTQFIVGAGYHKETTVFPGAFLYRKGTVHLNLNSNSSDQKLKFQLTGSYVQDENQLPLADFTSSALALAPVAPNPYNPDGTINWMPDDNGSTTYYVNPLATSVQNSTNKTSNLIANAILGYEIIPGLIIKSSFGYNKLQTNEISKYPVTAYAPEFRQYVPNGSSFLTNNNNSWIIEPQLEYKQKVSKGSLNVLIGTTISQQNSDQENIQASGFSNELVMEDLASATNVTGTNINSIYKYNALYGRLTYNWLDKYILNLTARRDGSSRFGSENHFHNFGAIGSAWVFSQESFIQSGLPFLSFGKLRGSFGTTGNDQIGDYQFMNIYQPVFITGNAYQNVIGLSPTRLTNPYLQWEETKKLQIGLELGFITDRILVTANYNLNRSSNQLTNTRLSSITGFSGVTKNFPAVVQNTGWELTLSSTNIKTKDFYWTTNFNITIPKNQLHSYFGQDKNNSIYIGRPLSSRTYFKYAGINDTTGVYQFLDAKGNITLSPSDPADKTVIVNTDPKFFGGIQNTLGFKNISLDFFFAFTKISSIDNVTYGQRNIVYPGDFYSGLGNQSTSVLDRWQKNGDKKTIQPYSAGKNTDISYIRNSDAIFVDASFIRLKNVSISWQLPDHLKKILHLVNARIFLNAQNLFTITNFRSLDPETDISLPPLRTITLGIQVTL
ncbi:SusC/RagA family TonB-linked outer membrane protein [Chitinophaga sp. CC14]|uniref:SusC/RagA family TonB-linked outer membrane protein n=1 Tax=Chitinophaga sp. CC14 TaxID=3029199 RepID=UPI003B82B19D